jgi:dihydrofolate reductase
MLIYSMSVSVDGFVTDREGAFEWTAPSEELFRFHLAKASVADEVAAALDATGKDVSIGGAGLAAAAIELGLVDELRLFRYPVVVGGGTPFLPPVTEDVPLDLIETRTFGSRVIYERYGLP